MFTACRCTNITPISKKESYIEFWSKASNPDTDKEILENLYRNNIIQLNNQIQTSKSDLTSIQNNIFWDSFRNALFLNKRGSDRKIRIFSIIALNFRYNDIQKELNVSNCNFKNSCNIFFFYNFM